MDKSPFRFWIFFSFSFFLLCNSRRRKKMRTKNINSRRGICTNEIMTPRNNQCCLYRVYHQPHYTAPYSLVLRPPSISNYLCIKPIITTTIERPTKRSSSTSILSNPYLSKSNLPNPYLPPTPDLHKIRLTTSS